MKLQLALDRLTEQECFHLMEEVKEHIDIIEIGTGVIKEYGMMIVKEMRERYPDKLILSDMKTCDAGRHEAYQAFKAGSDIMTVMALSSDLTIKEVLHTAEEMGTQVMVDLLEVHSKERIKELEQLGVRLVSLHIGKDRQAEGGFTTDLFSLVKGSPLEIAVAGGINLESLPEIIEEKPDIIIVGSAITAADNPNLVASEMKRIINQY
ncbi:MULTISPECIES: 3-hexulose-6-phosphate synthase [unclassified Oceanobacillus]|uniref:3-hexulose-6-phosphate synthase n=1 Tax=unclassified Oceanobacillus TaxID=2630292 RepID=UPI0012EC34C0|nr:3-hexulose-6-phosphate synthase [Oceanobacillus sp. AG]